MRDEGCNFGIIGRDQISFSDHFINVLFLFGFLVCLDSDPLAEFFVFLAFVSELLS